MSKKHFIATIFLLSCSFVHAQADCIILFKYKAAIKSGSIKVTAVGLPTTPFLIGYIKQNEERAFVVTKTKNNKISQVLASHLSSDFCAERQVIIERVFKRPTDGYHIKLFEGSTNNKQTVREVIIPIDAIKFSLEQIENREGIVVDLGEIKI